MRCEQCEKIPLVEIHTPQEYMLCIGSLARMLLAGEVEMTYQTCPLDKIMDNDNKWYAEKLFHQFRCTKCGTIYGIICAFGLASAAPRSPYRHLELCGIAQRQVEVREIGTAAA